MCVLRASGEAFDVDAFLSGSPLQPYKVFHRGEPRLPRSHPEGPQHATSGINIQVSEAPWSDLPSQISDAERFLETHREELQRLAESPGVVDLTLDFPINLRIDGASVVAQFDRFPASLTRLAGHLGIALELSIYPAGAR